MKGSCTAKALMGRGYRLLAPIQDDAGLVGVSPARLEATAYHVKHA